MFKFFKKVKSNNEEPYIIDFTENCWGHALYIDDNKSCKAHGFYEGLFCRCLKNKDIVFKFDKKSNSIWVAKVYNVENCDDPRDMFFCRYKTVTSDKDLNNAEIEALNKRLDSYKK